MKKLLILLCFSILLTACAKTLPESKSSVSSVPSSEKTAPSAVPDETAAAINVGEDGVVYTMEDITPAVVDFSFRWLQQASLLNDIDAGKNVMVSPFSLYEALSMTANGAEGETLQEILNVFGADSLEELNAVTTYDGGEALTVSNSIWIAERMGSLNQAYVQRVVPYQAGVFSRPFNEATKNEINQWVYEKTNGMIPNFLSQMDPGLAMLLFNAICFEGTWLDPYRDDQIAENETFTNAEGKQEITTMLKSGSECLYFSLNGADCTVKSYEGEKLVF
ncbi:MAG: hypothetical protein IKT07_03205, partial [Oscillospiraceae bacterium]|nr:hypothetical protein [Oscillospiraceae bacterium]